MIDISLEASKDMARVGERHLRAMLPSMWLVEARVTLMLGGRANFGRRRYRLFRIFVDSIEPCGNLQSSASPLRDEADPFGWYGCSEGLRKVFRRSSC